MKILKSIQKLIRWRTFLVFALLSAALAGTGALPISNNLVSAATMNRLSLVYYGPHDSYTDQRILSARPLMLIDNTPAGFWHGSCNSAFFQAQGINVYSYIYANYDQFPLSQNQALIDAIAREGSHGIFVDMVNPSATSYNQAIYNYAKSRGLSVIINPGTPYVDASIYSVADYVMTDEHYQGRSPTAVEAAHLNKTIVIGFGSSWTAGQAATYTNTAWAKGFAYSWHEQIEYVSLPVWLEQYVSLLSPSTQVASPAPAPAPTPTPTPTPTPAPTPSPAPAPGSAVIQARSSVSGTEFWAGGSFRGYSPVDVTLAPGTYYIGFRSYSPAGTAEQYVTISSGQALVLTYNASTRTISSSVLTTTNPTPAAPTPTPTPVPNPSPNPAPTPVTAEVRRAIASATDDGFSGTWSYTPGATWYQSGNPGAPYGAWFRFTNIQIPAGATILGAQIELIQGSWGTGTHLRIRADKADNPIAPVSTADHASRTRTSAAVDWDSGYRDWAWHTSPDFSSVIQELVNTFDYSSGTRAIQIFVENDGSLSGNQATGLTFEAGSPPRLYLKYQVAR